MRNIKNYLEFLKAQKNTVFLKIIEKEKEEFYPVPSFIDEKLKSFLKKKGIEKLYQHQVEGLEKLKNGENIIITTPTGSGKTLIYNLFIINEKIKNPETKALYIFPTKALTQDQQKTLKEFNLISSEIYDGDTPEDVRKKIKRSLPSIILTNPDMLHAGILLYHSTWRNFFSNLRFIVIDEVHTYRGIFGSQVSHVLRRLRRICNYYGSNPAFILASATINTPEKFAKELVGIEFSPVIKSSSGSGKKYFFFWDTGFESPYHQAITLLTESIKNNLSTIIFTNSRKSTELLQMWAVGRNKYLSEIISSYRAGYLPEERRKIEKKLFEGKLKGVISTSALELGIDVGNLDCCILFGYPGSITSTWQRIGRIGREKKDGIVIFMGLQDALDQFFIRNPEEFFKRKYEDVIINFQNEIISENHLKCAAVELPVGERDFEIYGEFIRKILVEKKIFSKTYDGKRYFYTGKIPHRGINLRTIGEIFSIVEIDNEKVIGEIEENKVFYECHPGAIYLHHGEKYEVIFINLQEKIVVVQKGKVDYYTQPNWWEKIEIIEKEKEKGEKVKINYGRIEVTSQVVSYEKRREKDKTLLSIHQLNLPSQKFQTQSLWIEIPENLPSEFKKKNIDFHGSIHGAEHAIIGIFPLEITCDRMDIGGYSFPFHNQTQKPTIFIYDGYPGGVGITKEGFGRIEKIINYAIETVKNCKCELGCPSCIQSPKCGNNNRPLDKKGSLTLLKLLFHTF